jgi:hypothetical protein
MLTLLLNCSGSDGKSYATSVVRNMFDYFGWL